MDLVPKIRRNVRAILGPGPRQTRRMDELCIVIRANIQYDYLFFKSISTITYLNSSRCFVLVNIKNISLESNYAIMTSIDNNFVTCGHN